jgi:transcriptional regulator with XRE-family HTH domain
MIRRLHLKLFYLRTRVRHDAQGVTAKALGVRPATMSHLEQGRSLPTLPMLLVLCKHYGVTPTYFLDDSRPIELEPCDIWSETSLALGKGDWLEVAEGSLLRTGDGMLLCPLGERSQRIPAGGHAERLLCTSRADAEQLASSRRSADTKKDQVLEQALRSELLGQRKPRGGKKEKREATGGS